MAIIVILAVIGIRSDFIGISYPVFVDNTDLMSPVLVTEMNHDQIKLSDGRTVEFEKFSNDDWRNKIRLSKNRVDIEGPGNNSEVWIYGDVLRRICGTPWAQPIRIPLVPNRIGKNQRILIAVGTLINRQDYAEPPGADRSANKSPDIVPAEVQP